MSCLANTDLCRVRGDTTPILITLTTDGVTPINITGNSFLLTVDPSSAPPDNTTLALQLTGVIVNGPAGQVSFTPSALQANLPIGVLYYDIQWTNGAVIRTIMRGSLEIQQDITK